MEKCVGRFLVYPIFRVFLLKSVKRMCICDYVKNRIDTCEKCIFRFEKGYKLIIALGSPKTYCFRQIAPSTNGIYQ